MVGHVADLSGDEDDEIRGFVIGVTPRESLRTRCVELRSFIIFTVALEAGLAVPVPKKNRDRASPGPGPERFLVPNFKI